MVIDNVNPYNHSEYKNFIRPYSPSLKDGDIFIKFNSYEWKSFLKTTFGQNRTIKIDDKVETINIDTMFDPNLISCPFDDGSFGKECFIKINTNIKKHYWTKDIKLKQGRFNIRYFKDGKLIRYFDYEPMDEDSLQKDDAIPYFEPSKLKSFLDNSFKKYFIWKNVPDEFFEIRKVKRNKSETDFK